MPKPIAERLQKITLNLFEEDCDFLKRYFGHGWSEQVRQWVHQHATGCADYHKLRKTLGDLDDQTRTRRTSSKE